MVEEACVKWIREKRSQGFNISQLILMERAKMFAEEFGHKDWAPSQGWFHRFCKRYIVKSKKLFGEAAAADTEAKEKWLNEEWPEICERFRADNIFKADETALYFRMLSDKTLAFSDDKGAGGKKNKERVSILLCCNMSGSDKLKPFMIGKSAKPRCFKGIKVENLVKYAAQNAAWMIGPLFEDWLKDVNRKMASQNRKILMLVDNCSAHNSAAEMALTHFELRSFCGTKLFEELLLTER